ncbi:MAG: trigger factor [Candidatus Abawacabacteria bacterium]|nr:trigger factor [Candidatus Abawacabacteria bacterium]
MKHSVKKLPPSQVVITLTIEPAELEKFRGKAIEKLRSQVNVSGFRPGKAPDDVVVQQIGTDKLLEETLQAALPELYYNVVVEEKLQPIAGPESKIITTEPFVLELTVPVLPEVKIGNYGKIKVKREEVKIDPKDIAAEVEALQKRFSTFSDVQRGAQMGDRVEIDFVGTADGKEVEGAKSKNHPLILGSKTFVPGFEEALVGMEVGQSKQFSVTFPKDYHVDSLKDKPVQFDVSLLKVEEMKLPEMNEEFFQKLRNPKITDEKSLQEEITAFLKTQREAEEQNRKEEAILKQLVDITEAELPEVLIHEEIHYMEEQFSERLQAVGLTFDRYLEANKKTHEDIHKEYEPEARRRLLARFALLELAKKENLEPTDEQAKDAMSKEGVAEKEIERRLPQMKARLRVELALDYLLKTTVK